MMNKDATVDKSAISYQVKCLRVRFEMSEEEKKRVKAICLAHKIRFVALLDAIVANALKDRGINEEWLYDLLKHKEETKTLFEGADPIESRKEANRNANSLNEVLSESDQYYSTRNVQDYIDQYDIETVLDFEPFKDGVLNLYTISIYMLHGGMEYLIGSTFRGGEIEALSRVVESSLYSFYGYEYMIDG